MEKGNELNFQENESDKSNFSEEKEKITASITDSAHVQTVNPVAEGGGFQQEVNENITQSINSILSGNTEIKTITSYINTISSASEGGITQQQVNQNNKEAIDNLNDEFNNIVNGNTLIQTVTSSIETINSTSEGGTTQKQVNEKNKQNIDNLNDEFNDIVNGNTLIQTVTSSIETVNSTSEGGTTQQQVNQKNKQNIDDLNNSIVVIDDKIDNLDFDINTSKVNATSSSLEGGSTQKDINIKNKVNFDSLNSDISDINDKMESFGEANTTYSIKAVDTTLEGGINQKEINQVNKKDIDSINTLISDISSKIDDNDLKTNTGNVSTVDSFFEGGPNQKEVNEANKKSIITLDSEIIKVNSEISDINEKIDCMECGCDSSGCDCDDITTSTINTVNSTTEGGTTQEIVNKSNKVAIDNLSDEISDIINNGVPGGNTSTITTTNSITEGGSTQKEVNEANKKDINSNTQAINNNKQAIDDLSDPVTSDITTVDTNTEGGATQQEVNEANKIAIDANIQAIDANTQAIDDLSDPVTSDITTVDTNNEGGATQQEVNEANKIAIDANIQAIDANTQAIDDLSDPVTSDITTVDTNTEGGATQQEVNEANKIAIDANTQAIDDLSDPVTSDITTVDTNTEGGATQQEVNEANKIAIDANIQAIDANTQAIDDLSDPVTSDITTVDTNTEGGATQQEVNEANKIAIDANTQAIDDLSDPVTSDITTVDTNTEGGATQQEVNEANKIAIDANTQAIDANTQAIDDLSDPVTSDITTVDSNTEGGATQQEVNEANKIAIDANTQAIDANTQAIDDLSDPVTSDITTVDTNNEGGATQQEVNEANKIAIDANTQAIGTNTQAIDDLNKIVSNILLSLNSISICTGCPLTPDQEVIFSNVITTDVTVNGGSDGSIGFDVTIANFVDSPTAVLNSNSDVIGLNPTAIVDEIALVDGANASLSFDNLIAGTYTIEIYDGETLISSEEDIVINEPLPDPEATVSNVVPVDVTVNGGSDGSIGFDVTIANFVDLATAVLNPAAGTDAISLVDGENAGLSFDNLIAGTYVIEIYDGETLISSEADIVISEPLPDPEATVSNVIPTDVTVNGGSDGSIGFDVTIANFVDLATAVLNPAAGTDAISLVDGANAGLSFDNLIAGTYTIEIYDGETLISSEEDIVISEPLPDPEATVSNVVPIDVTVNGGSDGSIGFDVTIANFIDSPTAVLNPAAGTDAISLVDGANADLSFDNLIAGTYTIEIYDGETLISSEADIVINEPLPDPEATVSNVVPIDVTINGGSDGSIGFDVTIANFIDSPTAVLNPAAGTDAISLVDGANADLSFDNLIAGTYTIEIYDGETLISSEADIVINEPLPDPEATVSNVIPVDVTINGGSDGSIGFDVTIANFVDLATAVLNPAAGTDAISLVDGANADLSFDNLIAGTYTIEIYDGETLISSEEDIVISEPLPDPEATVSNVIPVDVTTNGGSDGSIGFDVTIANFVDLATAVLNPAAGTDAISLVDGANADLSFDNLIAGTYTIEIYDGETLISSEADIVISEPLPDPEATVSNVVSTDVTTNGGSDGSIGFDVTIANFVDLATAVLNPAAGTNPISLVDGANTGLIFDSLIAGTYVIEIYDGEELISSEADIVISEPLPDPEATVSNIVPVDVTVNGGSDGSIGFDVTIANFVDLATAVLNPAAGTNPISLVDGANTGLIFDSLIAGTYVIEIYDGEELISSEADIVINEPLPDPEATVSNVIPVDVIINGGSDGSIGFDVTIANFVDLATAVLNPATGTNPISLVDGTNTGLIFDSLIAGTYIIEIYDGEELISSEEDIVINEPLPDPEATVSNVIPTDVTINGGSDGSIGFDVTIANFIDSPTAVLNPAAGTSPISLVDGANAGLSFDNLIAGTYTIEIYDGEELISSEADIVVSEPLPDPEATVSNVIPVDVTVNGGSDGSIGFDVTIANFVDLATAVLNPAAGTNPISLVDGANADLSFDNLIAGTYTIEIYDGETLISSEADIVVSEPLPDPEATVSNVIPVDVTVNGGSDGSIGFDVTIANFVDSPTAVLNPAAGTSPISLIDGANTGLIFDSLIAGTYTIEIYDGETLISSEADIVVSEPLPDPEATVSNVIPVDVTVNGGSDGSIGFDVTIANFVDSPTAVLNPAAGTSPISLIDGANTGLIFDSLISGTYVIEIYDGEELISSEEDIFVSEPLPDPEATVSNVIPTDVTINGGSDGSIGFDVTIANFIDSPTAVLNPAAGTEAISLVDGANADLSFDNLIAGTYTIEIYDGETLISSEADIVVSEPLPDPEATVSNVIPVDVTVNGGSDGSIGFDVTIANFVDLATAVLNPAAGTNPISLVDGANAGLSFDNLIAGIYTIEIYDGETLISSEADIVISEPLPDPEATVSNVIPTDVTINGGSDGSIGFDVTIANFVDLATAVLNPAAGTDAISLVDGANADLSFDNLIAGTYVIEIYDGETLISSEEDIVVSEPLPDPEATVSNVVPIDVTVNGGSDGSIGFDVTIANFVDLATAVLNPAAGTNPISLVDGANADLSFDSLIAGTYVIEIYDGEELISSEADIVISEPLPDPEATVSNIVPVDVTVNDGSDGSIGFDVTIANFVDLATAVLNPAAGTDAISLVDGANAGLSFDNLIAGTYTIEIYDGEELISSEADIVVSEPLPDPEATVSNVVPIDVTINGGSDGLIGFDVTIANFVDLATAVLNPAAGTNPISLVDGANADLSFDNLIAGTYTIEIYDGEELISSEADIVVSEPLPDPEATVSNVIPVDVTVNGGSDGSIGFDVTIANFVDLATAVLNPAAGTNPISLVDGANTGLIFDSLIAGTYVIEIYDGEELISSEADIVVSEPLPDPEATVSNVIPVDVTVNGGSDGSIGFDVTIANFVDLATAVLNPAAGTNPISLVDGANTGLIFDSLIAGTYVIEIYDGEELISSEADIVINEPLPDPEATVSNVIPVDVTVNGGSDGSIGFDVTIANFVDLATAVLNPAAGTSPISLVDGANADLSFDNLIAGTYVIEIYDGETLISSEEDIVVSEPLPDPEATVSNVIPIDVTVNGGSDGSIGFDVTIANFVDLATAVLNPAAGTDAISLVDGANADLSFDNLIAGTYVIEIYDGETLISSEADIVVSEPLPDPEATVSNVIPTDVTINGGSDGSIGFDVTIANFVDLATAVLNPAAGTDAISLVDGANADLSFDNLIAGTYTIEIYDGETLISSEADIVVSEPLPDPEATVSNVVPTDVTINGGSDGLIGFDVTIANFVDLETAVLNPAAGTSPISLVDGANTGLIFDSLIAGTYVIEIYDGEELISSETDIVISEPNISSNNFISLTPEDDDANSKTSGEILDSYLNYDIILSKNQHPNYVGNGLFIGKEIDINDLNQSGITSNNEIQKLIFTDPTNFNLDIIGDFTGIYYLKGINVGLTPLITEGIYENNDNFTWLEDITQFNMIIQKWWDNTRNNFSYTLWEQTTDPEQNYIYVAKNAADTALNGWRFSNQEISTGIGEGSYITMIYGFNFTSIDNLVISQTSNTFTLNDYTSYDLLLFKIEGSNFAVGDWVIKVSDIVADGITNHSYSNYQQEHFTITGNVLTWTSGGGLGHLELLGVKGIII